MAKKRCKALTRKIKPCRCFVTTKNNPEHHLLCHIHLTELRKKIKNQVFEDLAEYGICCFCNDYCNPCSQACGRCMRNW